MCVFNDYVGEGPPKGPQNGTKKGPKMDPKMTRKYRKVVKAREFLSMTPQKVAKTRDFCTRKSLKTHNLSPVCFLALSGVLWLSLAFSFSLWLSLAVSGRLWLSLVFFAFLWLSLSSGPSPKTTQDPPKRVSGDLRSENHSYTPFS